MKKVKYTSTLFYYDGPQVIEAQDEANGNYLGVMIDREGKDGYLIISITPERLQQFRSGQLDLRSALLTEQGWYLTDEVAGQEMELEIQTTQLEESEFLPKAGFILKS